MERSKIVPCLWFDEQAQAAADFYTATFGGVVIGASHYPTSGGNPGGKPAGSLLTVEFEVDGLRMTALNGGPQFTINPSISFVIETESSAEVERLFAALAEGGTVLEAPGPSSWSERYCWVQDRFGVSWQIAATSHPGTSIVPMLLFCGEHQGQTEAAISLYTRAFPESEVRAISHYDDGETHVGQVRHARFTIMGEPLTAMDSEAPQHFTFSEAVSLQVMCESQHEIDALWHALSHDPMAEQCGWIKDRFGVSWQIVPRQVADWLVSDDTEACNRVFEAIMPMKKLQLAELEAAYRGVA